MAGADQQAALARQGEECFRFPQRLDERFLDVNVRSAGQRLARGLEMRTRGRADVCDVRPRLLEQIGDGRE